MIIIFVGKKVFIGLVQHICSNPFAEQHEGAYIKQWGILISLQSNKILEIRIFRNLFHKFPVWVLEPILDDQGTQRHTQRLCNVACIAWKQVGILYFKQIPGILSPTCIQRLAGFILSPMGWLKSRKDVCVLSAGLYIRAPYRLLFIKICKKTNGITRISL